MCSIVLNGPHTNSYGILSVGKPGRTLDVFQCWFQTYVGKFVWYYRFEFKCTFLHKTEIFYMGHVKNLGQR